MSEHENARRSPGREISNALEAQSSNQEIVPLLLALDSSHGSGLREPDTQKNKRSTLGYPREKDCGITPAIHKKILHRLHALPISLRGSPPGVEACSPHCPWQPSLVVPTQTQCFPDSDFSCFETDRLFMRPFCGQIRHSFDWDSASW
jgi:hypothetical protein